MDVKLNLFQLLAIIGIQDMLDQKRVQDDVASVTRQ